MDKPGKREELAEAATIIFFEAELPTMRANPEGYFKLGWLRGYDAGRESRSAEVEKLQEQFNRARSLMEGHLLAMQAAEAKLAEQAAEIARLKKALEDARISTMEEIGGRWKQTGATRTAALALLAQAKSEREELALAPQAKEVKK